MASATPWAAGPQSQAIAQATKNEVEDEKVETHKPNIPDERTGTATTTSDSVSDTVYDSTITDKINSTSSSDEGDERVAALARAITSKSVKHPDGHYENPFAGSDDPQLNPSSGKFNARAWVKTLIGITSRDPDRYPERTAGISYRNLNVHGFGYGFPEQHCLMVD